MFEAFFDALAAMSQTAHLVQMFDSTVVRAHVSAAGAKGGRMVKRWAARAAASRPRSTSRLISMAAARAFTSPRVRPATARNFEILLDLGPDITPRAAVGDKGYDAKANRAAARERGICPVIPFKSSTAKNRPAFFPKALYRARARIEQLVGKLKRFKRIALRCEKTNKNYGSFVALRSWPHHRQIRPHGLDERARCLLQKGTFQ